MEKPKWVTFKPREIEELVLRLFETGMRPSRIGLILRDQFGVPKIRQLTGKKLTKLIDEAGKRLSLPEDLENLIKKGWKIREHLKVHRKDKHSERALKIIEARIHRLSEYYKRIGKLPKEWKYEPEKVKLLIR